MNHTELERARLHAWMDKHTKPRWWWPWDRRKTRIQKQRYLVLSATAAIKKISARLDTPFGSNCLYYPGSSRVAIMNDNDQMSRWMRDAGIRPICLAILRQQVEEAEKQGRVLWKQPGCAKSLRDLSTFLVGHGYKPFPAKDLDNPYTHDCAAHLLAGTDIASIF